MNSCLHSVDRAEHKVTFDMTKEFVHFLPGQHGDPGKRRAQYSARKLFFIQISERFPNQARAAGNVQETAIPVTLRFISVRVIGPDEYKTAGLEHLNLTIDDMPARTFGRKSNYHRSGDSSFALKNLSSINIGRVKKCSLLILKANGK